MLTTLFFGTAPNGHEAHLFVLSNDAGASVGVSDLGAALVSCRVPDGHGGFPDVLLGYSGAAGYASDRLNFGAVVGRCANRIAGARFELAGSSYRLSANDGGNSLHSGPHRWLERLWKVVASSSDQVCFELTSRKGDQGFPGSVQVQVGYRLTPDNRLEISYAAQPSEPTIINLTNHAYWNLDGHAAGSVAGHALQVFADAYTPLVGQIPTGEVAPVEGTPYDLRTPRVLESFFDQLPAGLDDNWCLGNRGRLVRAARLVGATSGIAMEVLTDAPGLQVFTADYLDVPAGKDGVHYGAFCGVALETQYYPDAIHHKGFPQPVFTPNRPFRSRTVFAFGAEA